MAAKAIKKKSVEKDIASQTSVRASGYQQIAVAIQDWIRNGRLQPGDRLPPEMELARQFDVTRLTIRRALEVLEARALIHRVQRLGTFVSDEALLPPVVSPMSQSTRQMGERTKGISGKFLGSAKVQPERAVVSALKLERDAVVHEFRFLRSIKSEPLGYFIYWVPEWVAKQLGPVKDVENFHLRRQLIEIGFDAHRIHQSVGAQITDATLAEVLNLQVGEAVLRFRSTYYDVKERPFSYSTTYFRADNYEYDIEFIDDSKIKNLRDR